MTNTRKALAVTLLALIAITATAQDFSANLYEFYGDNCVYQPDQFSPQYGIRYNSGGWTYAGLDTTDCGTVPVPQRILNKSNNKADNIWLAQHGTLARS
jgi:hypothetical protein